MNRLNKLKRDINAQFMEDIKTLTLLEEPGGDSYQPVASFAEYATRVYPFLELCDFHRIYYRLLQLFAEGRIRKLMVSMPPQHGKSVGASTLLPSYMLGLNPDMRIAIASYSASLASKLNRRVQRILESDEYGEIFPETTIKRGNKSCSYIRRRSDPHHDRQRSMGQADRPR